MADEPVARVVQAQLIAADVGRALEGQPALLGLLEDELVDRTLANHAVAVGAQADLEHELGDVAQSDAGAVEQVLALARAVQAPGDAHLAVLERQYAVAVVEDQRDLGHAQRLALGRAGEDQLFGFPRPHRAGGLLAQHPAHGIRDVRLARPVRADDDHDARLELGHGPRRERLEADELEALQEQEARIVVGGRGSGVGVGASTPAARAERHRRR